MEDFGKLLLRLTVGGLLLLHGIHKIQQGFDKGVEGIKPMVVAHDLPEVVAYGVYVGEVLAPVLLILGIITRIAALAVAINMGVAVWLNHLGDFGLLNPQSGAWKLEVQAFYFLGALAILFLGPGRLAVMRANREP